MALQADQAYTDCVLKNRSFGTGELENCSYVNVNKLIESLTLFLVIPFSLLYISETVGLPVIVKPILKIENCDFKLL